MANNIENEIIDHNSSPIPDAADIAFPCCLHENDRTLDWCENNCIKYYSCDTVAMAIDDLKIRDGECFE